MSIIKNEFSLKEIINYNELEGCKKGMLTILRDKVFSFF